MWGYFHGESQEKILLCKGGHYMKNKTVGGVCVLSTQPDQQKKAPMQKCAKKRNAKNYQTFIEKYFLARFAHSAFYKIHISEADNRHAPLQHAKYVLCFFIYIFYF